MLQPLSRLEREKITVKIMIELFCQAHHHKSAKLCHECLELYEYASNRITRCPFSEKKTSCVKCRVHCYQVEMREKIRYVMRYSGPRMMLFHPILSLKHLIQTKRPYWPTPKK